MGGSEAQAGFSSGDGLLSFSLPGSQTPQVLELSSTSNVQRPGVWVFRVDGNITNTTSQFNHVLVIRCYPVTLTVFS